MFELFGDAEPFFRVLLDPTVNGGWNAAAIMFYAIVAGVIGMGIWEGWK